MRYTLKEIVKASMMDTDANLSMLGATQLVQDSLCAYFAEFGCDNVSTRKNYNALWVFVKNKIEFFKSVEWNEIITAESFISSHNGAVVTVDTSIKNQDGVLVCYAKTEACVLDLKTGRIRRVYSAGFPKDFETENSEYDMNFHRFDCEAFKKIADVIVRSTNIDYCNHTNNVEYLRFILNTLTSDEVRRVKSMDIYYINQSKEGNTLSIYREEKEDGAFYEIKNGEVTVVKCKIGE